MKTKLVNFLEEFGDWWSKQENPNTNDFIKYKIDKEELDDMPKFTQALITLSTLLGYKHD